MALSTVTLTGTLQDLVGVAIDAGQSVVWLESTEQGITNPDVALRLGPTHDLTLDATGTFTLAGLPADTMYRLHARYLPASADRVQELVTNWFELTADSNIADPDLAAITPAALTPDVAADIAASVATLASYARPAKALEVLCHSYGTSGASASQYLWQNLVARRIGATLTDRSISGSKFINGNPGTNCGYATMLQNIVASAARTLSYKVFSPNVGIIMLLEALNSLSDSVTNTGVDTALAVSAWGHAVRNMISRAQISALIESTAGAPITLGGSGSWATQANTNQNSGTGYSQNTSSGATATIAVPSDWKGGVLVLGFVGNRIGGTVAASDITFTVDGVATKPIGYPGTFTTKDVAPSTGTGAQYVVARFQLAAGAHTVVATSGTGGIAFDCIWVEADTPRPCVWGGQPRTPGSSSTTNAAVVLGNSLTASIIANEFKPGCATFVDLDALLAQNSDYFADTVHPNDAGHAIIADAMVQAWTEMTVVDHQLIYA